MTDNKAETPETFLARLRAGHKATIDQVKHIHGMVQRINEHEDRVIVWFVSLAAGAALLSLQIPTHLLPNNEPLWILLALLPFGASTLCGVLCRILIMHVQKRSEEHHQAVLHDLIFAELKPPRLVGEFAAEMRGILERKMPKATKQYAALGEVLTPITIGLFCLGIVVLCVLVAVGASTQPDPGVTKSPLPF